MRKTALFVALVLGACSRPAERPAESSGPKKAAAPATDAYLGRWTGVEGMYLVVSPGPAPGRYGLEMQWDLDHQGRFEGQAEGAAIAFSRDDARLTLRPTDGAATGLKYLDGKAACLTVQPGEGYCRD